MADSRMEWVNKSIRQLFNCFQCFIEAFCWSDLVPPLLSSFNGPLAINIHYHFDFHRTKGLFAWIFWYYTAVDGIEIGFLTELIERSAWLTPLTVPLIFLMGLYFRKWYICVSVNHSTIQSHFNRSNSIWAKLGSFSCFILGISGISSGNIVYFSCHLPESSVSWNLKRTGS